MSKSMKLEAFITLSTINANSVLAGSVDKSNDELVKALQAMNGDEVYCSHCFDAGEVDISCVGWRCLNCQAGILLPGEALLKANRREAHMAWGYNRGWDNYQDMLAEEPADKEHT